MGDRYEIEIKCANCKKSNKHWHAESSGSMSFICVECKKINWVEINFTSRIVTSQEEKKLYKKMGFESFDLCVKK